MHINLKCKSINEERERERVNKQAGVLRPVNHYGYIRERERERENVSIYRMTPRMFSWRTPQQPQPRQLQLQVHEVKCQSIHYTHLDGGGRIRNGRGERWGAGARGREAGGRGGGARWQGLEAEVSVQGVTAEFATSCHGNRFESISLQLPVQKDAQWLVCE